MSDKTWRHDNYAELCTAALVLQQRIDRNPLEGYLPLAQEARDLYQRALRIRDDDPKILYGYARVCGRIGPEETAIETLRAVLRIDPAHAPAHELLSVLLAQRGDLSGALHHVEFAVTIDPALNSAWEEEIAETRAAARSGRHVRFVRYPPGDLLKNDFDRVVREYVIGDLNKTRFVRPDTKFFAIGSCFARNIALALRANNYDARNVEFGEHINSTFANRALVEWMLGKVDPSIDPRIQQLVGTLPSGLLSLFANAEVLILTLGVAPCFFDRETGRFIMPRPSMLNARALANLYNFRMTTVAENADNVRAIIAAVRGVRPNGKIILTLSPVPLTAAVGVDSAVQADCVSKSTLRVAVNEVLSDGIRDVLYWPSFEIIRWLSGHVGQFYGLDDGFSSHVNNDLVEMVVSRFLETFKIDAEETIEIPTLLAHGGSGSPVDDLNPENQNGTTIKGRQAPSRISLSRVSALFAQRLRRGS